MGLLVYLYVTLCAYFINAETVCNEHSEQNDNKENIRLRYCLVNEWCVEDKSFPNFNEIDLVVIEQADYIPTCFIYQLQNLRTLYGVNLNISYIDLVAFEELPRLEKINLAFNFIKEVKFGMFNRLPLNNLNLSWNEISFIGEAAFSFMDNLKRLDLSRNYLTSFDGRYFFTWDMGTLNNNVNKDNLVLEEILLPHNRIQSVQNFSDFVNLKILDLSHNKIFQISETALGIRSDINILDLSDNYISSVNFKKTNIREIRLAFNNFKHINSGIELVRFVSILGNPFRCSDYDALVNLFRQQGVTLADKNINIYFLTNSERENYPRCLAPGDYFTYDYFVALDKFEGKRRNYRDEKYPPCNCNNDCSDGRLCKAGQCWNPCEESVCHGSEICEVTRHQFRCACPTGYVRDPYLVPPSCVLDS